MLMTIFRLFFAQPGVQYLQHVMLCLNKGGRWLDTLRVYDDIPGLGARRSYHIYLSALNACRCAMFV